MPTFALEAVATHVEAFLPGESGLLFRRRDGRPMLSTTLNGRWRQTVCRAGLPATVKLHGLRHHYASILIDGGESVTVVQERLGHSSAVETLKTYAHLWPASEERTRQVVERAWSAPADSLRTDDTGQAADQGG